MPNKTTPDAMFYIAKVAVSLILLIPAMIGVPGLIFFTRKSVRTAFGGAQLDTTGPGGLKNLIPLATYHIDETGYWKRLPFISGLFYGLWMAIFAAVFPWHDSSLLYSRMTRVVIALLGSILFGILFSFLLHRRIRFLQDALYAGRSWIDSRRPANRQLDYRFLCSLIANGRPSAIGGVMYLGADGMFFVPHKRNRNRDKHILEMAPLSELKIGVAEGPNRNFIERILIPRPQPFLEVCWVGGCARFLVPSATGLAQELSKLKDNLS